MRNYLIGHIKGVISALIGVLVSQVNEQTFSVDVEAVTDANESNEDEVVVQVVAQNDKEGVEDPMVTLTSFISAEETDSITVTVQVKAH